MSRPDSATGDEVSKHRLTPKLSLGRRRLSTRVSVRLSLFAFVVLNLWVIYGFSNPELALSAYRVVYRAPFELAPTPEAAALEGLPALTTTAQEFNALPTNGTRAIDIMKTKVALFVGGVPTRFISLKLSGPLTLGDLDAMIHDPSWISEPSKGDFVVKAALIDSGANFLASAPETHSIELMDKYAVFLIFENGVSARFDHVAVSTLGGSGSWHGARSPRPFILFTSNAKGFIAGCSLSNLGYDWTESYGISWFHVSTGAITDSTVTGGFIGMYTQDAHNILANGDTFQDGHLYGVDPHTYSRDLTIENSRAIDNASHGIIFSVYVTKSRLIDNVSAHNGESGIVMDRHSSQNQIDGNLIFDDKGDGIEFTRSSNDETVKNNVIRRVRVGIRATSNSGRGNHYVGDSVSRVVLAVQGVSPNPSQNRIDFNEDGYILVPPPAWEWTFNFIWWPLIAIGYLVVFAIRRRELADAWRRSDDGRGRPHGPVSWRRLMVGYRQVVSRERRELDLRTPIEVQPSPPFLGPPGS